MIEVDHTKRAGNEWVDMLAMQIDHRVRADMWEDIVEAQFNQSQLDIVGMSTEVL